MLNIYLHFEFQYQTIDRSNCVYGGALSHTWDWDQNCKTLNFPSDTVHFYQSNHHCCQTEPVPACRWHCIKTLTKETLPVCKSEALSECRCNSFLLSFFNIWQMRCSTGSLWLTDEEWNDFPSHERTKGFMQDYLEYLKKHIHIWDHPKETDAEPGPNRADSDMNFLFYLFWYGVVWILHSLMLLLSHLIWTKVHIFSQTKIHFFGVDRNKFSAWPMSNANIKFISVCKNPYPLDETLQKWAFFLSSNFLIFLHSTFPLLQNSNLPQAINIF